MNLLLAAIGIEPAQRNPIVRCLSTAAARYPQVRRQPIRSWASADAFLVSAASEPAVTGSREYVAETPETVTAYDGVILDPRGDLPPHKASVLAAAWHDLPRTAEGRFVAMRLDRIAGRIDVLVDPLGMCQVFEMRVGRAWYVSTSVGVLEAIANLTEPDPVGVSMLLSTDWVWGQRTLRRGVTVVPGGMRLSAGQGEIHRTESSLPRELAELDQVPFDSRRATSLASDLTTMLRTLSEQVGVIHCPISAGKDSRVLTAITVAGDLPARFWTQGDAGRRDVVVGAEMAELYGLRHRHANRPNSTTDSGTTTTDVIANWDELVRAFLMRTDGLASLSLLGNVAGIPDAVSHLETTLSGLGGEIGRHSPAKPEIFHAGHSHAAIKRQLIRQYVNHAAGLIRPEAVAMARDALGARLDAIADVGFRSRDVSSAFYAFERVRRWAGNNPRQFAPSEDVVLPFCTRPYLLASYATPAGDRYSDALPRGLILATVPEMLNRPGFDRPWRVLPPPPGRRDVYRSHVSALTPHRARPILTRIAHRIRRPTATAAQRGIWREIDWLEAKREWILDLAMSRPSSQHWSYIDRRRFEFLMRERTDPNIRGRWMLPLLAATSLFAYEALREEEMREGP